MYIINERITERTYDQEIFARCIPLKEGSSTVIVSSDLGRTSGGGGVGDGRHQSAD